MKTSRRGQQFLKDAEGLRLTAYRDATGTPTIGYGHTSDDYFPVKMGMKITKAKAEDLFRHDVEEAESFLDRVIKVALNGNQYGALISLIFNIGVGNFRTSTLLKKLNRGDYQGAANEFGKWTKSKGKRLDGLVRRRADEKALFMTPGALENKVVKNPPIKGATPETQEAREAKGDITPDKPSFWTKLVPAGFLGGGMTLSDGFDIVDRIQYTFLGLPVWAWGVILSGIGIAVLWNHYRKTD